MKLNLLYEGFDFNRPGDDLRLFTARASTEQLRNMANNPHKSRISVLLRLLTGIMGIITQITIESDEEKQLIDDIADTIDSIRAKLNIPDGPIPSNVTYDLGLLAQLIINFCNRPVKYRRRT